MPFLHKPDRLADCVAAHARGGRAPWHRVMARRGGRRWNGWLAFLFCLWLPAMPAADAPRSEYEVKAALLLNFVRFSDWPSTAFTARNSPYVIGVLGRDPFGNYLEKTFEGKTNRARSFVIRRLSDDQEIRNCHLLFISSSERRRLRDLREKLKGAAVLTVGEMDEFLDYGGVINIRLKNESVKFEINLKAAQAAQLKLDANLVGAADSVRGKYE
jgi:hypothetical protein